MSLLASSSCRCIMFVACSRTSFCSVLRHRTTTVISEAEKVKLSSSSHASDVIGEPFEELRDGVGAELVLGEFGAEGVGFFEGDVAGGAGQFLHEGEADVDPSAFGVVDTGVEDGSGGAVAGEEAPLRVQVRLVDDLDHSMMPCSFRKGRRLSLSCWSVASRRAACQPR